MQGMGGWGHFTILQHCSQSRINKVTTEMQHINPHLALTAAALAGKEKNGIKNDFKSIAIATCK